MRAQPWFTASFVLVALSVAFVAGAFLLADWGSLLLFGVGFFLLLPAGLLAWTGARVRRAGRLTPGVAAVLGAAAGVELAGMAHAQWLAPLPLSWPLEPVAFLMRVSLLLLGFLGAWVDRPDGALLLAAGALAGGALAYLLARRATRPSEAQR